MKLNYDAFKPLPDKPKAKRVRKKNPKISWEAFKAEPPKPEEKVKK